MEKFQILLESTFQNVGGLLIRSQFADQLTDTMLCLRELHHYVMFYLVQIFSFVGWILFWTYNDFNRKTKAAFFTQKIYALRKIMFGSRHASHSTRLEVIWTIIPSGILVGIALPSFGFLYFMDELYFPDLTVKAIGHQWYWSFEYSDIDIPIIYDSNMIHENELILGDTRLLQTDTAVILPYETEVRIIITSQDVLHSFSLPSLAIKVDAAPGRLNQIGTILTHDMSGVVYGQCSELCGVNHGFMPIKLVVTKPTDFTHFLFQKK